LIENKKSLQVLAADWEGTGARKKMLPVERFYAYNLKVFSFRRQRDDCD